MSPKARTNIVDKYPYAKRLNKILAGKIISEISEITGANRGTVGGYMKGTQAPSAEFLSALSAAGYDTIYVLTGKQCMATPSPAPADHTVDAPRAPLYSLGKNRFLNALHTMAEMEECARVAGGELENDWDDVLEDFRASVEEMMQDAQREKKEAEEQAQKSQAG